MTYKLFDFVSMYALMLELAERKVPLKVNYWIMKNVKRMKTNYEFYCVERDKIYLDCLYKKDDSYTHKDELGKIEFNFIPDKENEFYTRFNELNTMEIDYVPYILNFDEIMDMGINWNIEPRFLIGLSDLLTMAE